MTAVLCKTRDGEPLATVSNLPGDGADLTPAELRALAAGLLQVAADAEAQPLKARRYLPQRRVYALAELLAGMKPGDMPTAPGWGDARPAGREV